MKIIKRALLGLFLTGLLYLLFWPVPVEPIAFEPQKPQGFVGKYAENQELHNAGVFMLPPDEIGPEDLAVMPDGKIYTTSLSGTLYRIDGVQPEKVDQLDGRPLGLKAGPDGALYIADSFRGIMRWNGPGTLEPVASEIDGEPIVYANQLDLARDGTIYFSNSSDRFDPETMGGTKPTSILTIWEQSDTGYVGRVLPDGHVEKLVSGFVYTNGVALSPDEDYLLISETGRARIHRFWLKGDRQGELEVFLDNLPGYPDNLEAQGDGTYWLAFASPRVPSEALMPYPFLRKIVWRLGPSVRPAPIHRGMLVHFDGEGNILRTVQDPEGRLGITTGGKVVNDILFVMTLDSPFYARLPLPRSQ